MQKRLQELLDAERDEKRRKREEQRAAKKAKEEAERKAQEAAATTQEAGKKVEGAENPGGEPMEIDAIAKAAQIST